MVIGVPLAGSFVLSFHRWNLIQPPRFVGLQNYLRVMTDTTFHQAIRVTATVTTVSFILQAVLAYRASQLLNHPLVRWRSFWHAILILPYMLAPVVIAMMWRAYLNMDFGIVNVLIEAIGLRPRAWANERQTALIALIFVEVWHKTSFLILVFSAGMSSLRQDVFEAAEIDGAGYWKRTFDLQIPMLAPVLRVGALFQIVELIRMFDKAYLLTEGGPGRLTTTLSLSIFQRSFQAWQIGRASAMTYLMMGLMAVVSALLLRGVRKEGQDA